MKQDTTPTLRQHAIPFFFPSIEQKEIDSVVETMRSGWLTTGPKVKQFERAFAERVGARHALATNSCTGALHLALEAAGVSRGDEVLVPTLTFAATAEVIVHLGARPVLVDCRADKLTIDPERIEPLINERTKAVIPVHYAGQPCDMDDLLPIAKSRGLTVIEDAAHAIPSRFADQTIGSIGDMTCFSFYANKTITTGEGGMVTTDRDDLADRIRIMALHGISKDAWKRFSAEGSWYYEILAPGYKYNMTDLAAAIGIQQLARCDEFWRRREAIAKMYTRAFKQSTEVAVPYVAANIQHAWHLYVLQLRLEQLRIDRNGFIDLLGRAGIGTSVHYLPLHMHPYYRDTFGYKAEDLPVARSAYERIISLPIYPKMTDSQVEYVINTVTQIIREYKR